MALSKSPQDRVYWASPAAGRHAFEAIRETADPPPRVEFDNDADELEATEAEARAAKLDDAADEISE
jgi:hypothetical protein